MVAQPITYSLDVSRIEQLMVEEPCEGKDAQLLNEMRAIIEDYVSLCAQNKMNEYLQQEYQASFEAVRSQLRDQMLKDYSSFDFMVNIYRLEHTFDNDELE